jgi:hypothetical protein
MNILPQSAKRLVRPSVNGTETLVEYIQTIEPDPLPGPKQVTILEVLNSVYPLQQEEEKPEVKEIDEPEQSESIKIEVLDKTDIIKPTKATVGFALASTATITSIGGWLSLLSFHNQSGIAVALFIEFLAVCFAVASFTCPGEKTGTRPLAYLALMITVGWLPIYLFLSDAGELFVDFLPLLFIAFFVAVIIFIAVQCQEEDTRYEFKLNR